MLGRCLSCGAVAAWFLSWKRAFGVPKTPIFFRCAGELQRPLFITPMSTAKKLSYTCRQIHWILVACTRSKKIVFYCLPRLRLRPGCLSGKPALRATSHRVTAQSPRGTRSRTADGAPGTAEGSEAATTEKRPAAQAGLCTAVWILPRRAPGGGQTKRTTPSPMPSLQLHEMRNK